MQSAKDSFFIALRDRLAALNPQRTVTIAGVLRPAVIVPENEAPASSPPLPDAFYLLWGKARAAEDARRSPRPLLALECTIHYRTRGSDALSGLDRGRRLAQLDAELLQITQPALTPKRDHTQSPPADLGTVVLWQRPELAAAEDVGGELRRSARLEVFFYPEVDS